MLERTWLKLPRVIRFMIDHFANGAVLGCAFGLVLIRLDIGGIGQLLETSDSAGPTALFFFHGALLFGTLSIAVAVLNLGANDS